MIELSDIQKAIKTAESVSGNDLPDVEGYSSKKVRRLLNQLCSIPGVTYLEIGVHLGSTFIPAVYGNNAPATCIDNWSMFGNLHPAFLENIQRWLPDRQNLLVINNDAFSVDKSLIFQPVNVYFYDGPHDWKSQELAFTYFDDILADRFVAIVDDCNWEEPREGTRRAFSQLRYHVLWDTILPARYERDLDQWWNGLLVALVEKRS